MVLPHAPSSPNPEKNFFQLNGPSRRSSPSFRQSRFSQQYKQDSLGASAAPLPFASAAEGEPSLLCVGTQHYSPSFPPFPKLCELRAAAAAKP